MTIWDELAVVIAHLAQGGSNDLPGEPALLGFVDDSGNYVIKTDRPNWLWVRPTAGTERTPTQAWNMAGVERIPSLPVRIKRLGGRTVIVGRDIAAIDTFDDVPMGSRRPGSGNIEPVAARQMEPGLVHMHKASGAYTQSVYVEPFFYHFDGADKYYSGGTLDLSSHWPASGLHRWVKVGFDPAAGSPVAVAGDAVLDPTVLLTSAMLAAIEFDDPDHVPLAGVRIKASDTVISDERRFTDCRPWWTAMHDYLGGLKHNPNASTDPTVTDDADAGYVVNSRWTNTTNDKEFICLDATAGAAVWTETTGAGSGSGIAPLVVNLDNGAGSGAGWATVGLTNWTFTAWAFDQSSAEHVDWLIPLPASASGVTSTLTLRWTALGGSVGQNVLWRAIWRVVDDDDALTAAGTTDAFTEDALLATSDLHVISNTLALTGWSAGEALQLRIQRYPSGESTSLAADAYLLGAAVEFS